MGAALVERRSIESTILAFTALLQALHALIAKLFPGIAQDHITRVVLVHAESRNVILWVFEAL
jgi:hypothetical protein